MGGKWVYWSPKDCLSLPVSKLYIWESRIAKGHTLITSEASLRWFRRSDSGECRVIENREKKDAERERSLTLPTPTHIVFYFSPANFFLLYSDYLDAENRLQASAREEERLER